MDASVTPTLPSHTLEFWGLAADTPYAVNTDCRVSIAHLPLPEDQ